MISCVHGITALLLLWVSLTEPALGQLSDRILGGRDANIEDYPYQLSLEGGGSLLCSAAILSQRWALTAAHCVYKQPSRWLRLRAGSSRSGKDGVLYKIAWYILHEDYNHSEQDFDVAVMRVSTPFYFTPSVQPLSLAFRSPRAGDDVTVTGWGYLEEQRLRRPKQLQAISLKILDWDQCKKIYRELTPRMMCAGAMGRDTCYGDSGGPLVADGDQVVGIVAWGYRCTLDGQPGVYMNITYFGAWVKQTIYNNGGF